MPHGQCAGVAVGGHVSSGGFSVYLGRSFGFFCDHVTSFRIALAPDETHERARIVTVNRPETDDVLNDALWYAVIGGSPGSFGIILDVLIEPLFDSYFNDARTMCVLMPYTKPGLEKTLEFITKHSGNDELQQDLNMSVGFFQGNVSGFLDQNTNLDVYMAKHFPKKYDTRFPFSPKPSIMLAVRIFLFLLLSNTKKATWTNLQREFKDDVEAQAFFKEMKTLKAELEHELPWALRLAKWLAPHLLWVKQREISPDEPTPISVAMKQMEFKERVQQNPYRSASYVLPAAVNDNFPRWITNIVDEASRTPHLWPDIGFVPFGGKYVHRPEIPSALAHRNQGFLLLYYVHYDDVVNFVEKTDKHKKEAEDNCTRVKHGITHFGTQNGSPLGEDKRWNMFSHSDDISLDALSKHYFDDQESYNKVCMIKQRVDPFGVFTSNSFGVK